MSELNDGKHVQIPSLYPTVMYPTGPAGFSFSSASFPIGNEVEPVHFALFTRQRKMRYIEIWCQLSQVFRRAGKFDDARSACHEAQKVETCNADIEYEVGNLLHIHCSFFSLD